MAKHSLPSKPEPKTGIAAIDPNHAPFIFFEGAPSFGNSNGVVSVTLCAGRHLPAGDRIITDIIATAHLRCGVPAAIDLRDAIDKALLLGTPIQGDPN